MIDDNTAEVENSAAMLANFNAMGLVYAKAASVADDTVKAADDIVKVADDLAKVTDDVAKASDDVVSAAERAAQIHKAVPAATQKRTTIAVTETAEGTRVVSSSEKRLRPVQRALLGANEVEGVGLGHAEVTGVNAANSMGLTPTGTAASRPICFNCADFLKNLGIKWLSPLKKEGAP